MKGSIYFLRHGETHANEQNYLAGIVDVPLSDLGERQAKEAGRIILRKGLKFDEVHTSNLVRTKATALIALKESGQEDLCAGGYDDIAYGIGIARKGWLERQDILDARPAGNFLRFRK